jgi:hypothetical protein
MIKQITSFRSIPIVSNTLVVLDIDDTIMGYREFSHTYFIDRISHYKQKHGSDIIAIDFAVSDWIEQVEKSTPHHMDEDGFWYMMNMLNKTDSRHFFLTARNPNFRKITEKHLECLNISNSHVYYVSGCNKGEYLKNIIDKHGVFDKIVFVDDSEKNLHDMQKTFGEKIDLYHFVKKYNTS